MEMLPLMGLFLHFSNPSQSSIAKNDNWRLRRRHSQMIAQFDLGRTCLPGGCREQFKMSAAWTFEDAAETELQDAAAIVRY
jgi:hypothetical protein